MDAKDISLDMTSYGIQTILTLHRIYGNTSTTKRLCLDVSRTQSALISAGTLNRPIFSLEEYSMKDIKALYHLPAIYPFLPDNCATKIPEGTNLPERSDPDVYVAGKSVMHDVVEAIRQRTVPTPDYTGHYPPSTTEIQGYMSANWPDKYPGTVAEAKGWKNSVNQCLTHGQGWNFITYDPVEGKNKRHLLLERAYNGVCILGSGQCKALNDKKKLKKQSSTSPVAPEATFANGQVVAPVVPSVPYTHSYPPPPSVPSNSSTYVPYTPSSNPLSTSVPSYSSTYIPYTPSPYPPPTSVPSDSSTYIPYTPSPYPPPTSLPSNSTSTTSECEAPVFTGILSSKDLTPITQAELDNDMLIEAFDSFTNIPYTPSPYPPSTSLPSTYTPSPYPPSTSLPSNSTSTTSTTSECEDPVFTGILSTKDLTPITQAELDTDMLIEERIRELENSELYQAMRSFR